MKLPPNCIVVAYAVAALLATVDLPYEQTCRILQKGSHLVSPTSKVTTAHCKPTEDREVQMNQYKIVESKES